MRRRDDAAARDAASMILEGRSCSVGWWWTNHLQSTDNNERVEFMGAESLSGQTIAEYFMEMEALSKGTKCTNYFYQYNIDPRKDEHLTDKQWEEAHAITRKNHGLEDLAWFRVRHVKIDEHGNEIVHEHGIVS